MKNRKRYFLAPLFVLACLSSAQAQTVSPELFSALKWRLIGPFRGGRAVAVAGIPGNATTFYFGAVDGGVWQTTDAGVVWKPIFDSQHVASIGALAVAPSDPQVIYAGTGESDIRSDLSSGDGIYKSTDGGQTWSNVGLRDTKQISRIMIDPRDARVVYVAALGHAYTPNAERGVFKSTDGGANWTKVLDQGPDIGASDLAIATGNPDVLFATVWRARRPPWSTYPPIGGPGSGLYRSRDGGATWMRLTGTSLPDGDWGRTAVGVSADGKRVYALIDAKKGGLYRSDDGGDSWVLANSDRRITSRAWYFGSITVDAQNPDIIYIPNVALYRSEDGGKTISVLRGAPGGDDYHQIWVDPKDSSRMVLATDQGTTVSINYGKTWSTWYNQPTAQLYHVITDDRFPYAVYGNEQDSGAVGVKSRGDSGQITPRDWFPASGSESGYIAIDPNDPNILYVTETLGGVSRFDLRTSFSQNITPWPVQNWGSEIVDRKYRDPWTPVLLFSPFDKKTLYLGTQFVMKTLDGGLHWETISPDLTGSTRREGDKKPDGPPTVENAKERGYGVVYTIAPSALNGDLIWAGSDTGLIHITRDGGKSWKDVTPKGLTDWGKISLIEASHFDAAEAYAAVDRHRLDDRQPYLYRTRDYGATWQAITNGISEPSFLRAVREDPRVRGLLYAATEFGVYVSFDDGDHWQSLQLNLPVTAVHDLVIHGDDLVIATHGRSFWILDDITPLRQTSAAIKAGTSWLYQPGTAMRVDNDTFPGTPLPPEEPTAQNPPNGAVIDYYLKSAASQVKLEMFDGQQKLVRSFASKNKDVTLPPMAIAERWFPKPDRLEKTAGMHRFVWNLAWGSSGSDGGPPQDEDDFFAPHGPRAVPGNYQVRLTVDGKTWTQPLTVAMDPRSAATPEELAKQLDLGRQIFVGTIRSRQALAEMQSVQKQLSDLKLDAARTELKAAVTQVQADMTQIIDGDASNGSIGLKEANSGLSAALGVVESGDRAVPSQAITVYEQSDQAMKARLSEWSQLKTGSLKQLNDQLKQAKLTPIAIAEIEREVEYFMSR
ncbi:MAG TPA: hypothetical protein VK763_03715 [Terriglobales bacterium]|nr:hypothetical protein [Terriglobales bacterium]